LNCKLLPYGLTMTNLMPYWLL